MSLLCYGRAAEESYCMGCKEDGVKTQRNGLDIVKHWLRPLVCLQHRLQMTASYHLTDAPSWLQAISYCTSVYTSHTSQPALSSSLRGQIGLGCWFFCGFFSFLFQTPPSSMKKKYLLSTINSSDFSINSETYGCIEDVRSQFIDVSVSLQILPWAMLLFSAGW